MTFKKISVLVSYPDHFEIAAIEPDLETFQKLVGGFIEAVPRPTAGSGWFAYCNEEGKLNGLPTNNASNDFLDKLFASEGARPFTHFDTVVGTLVWFAGDDQDNEASFPIEYIQRYTSVHVESAWKRNPAPRSPVITVVRDGFDIRVFDQRIGALIPQTVSALVRQARSRPDHGTIEAWCMSPAAWVELRVEIMDQIGVVLHDERNDRSYG